MKRIALVFLATLVAATLIPAARGDIGVIYTIDTQSGRAPISPYVYGSNWGLDSDENLTARRSGGNRLTGYNWENNFSNAGSDWYHHSDRYLSDYLPPSQQLIPGIVLTDFHDSCLAENQLSVITLQMAGYVAADDDGTVDESETAPSDRWKEVVFAKGSAFCDPPGSPDTGDDYVYMDEFVNFLVDRYGDASTPNGVKCYSLDNEPALWSHTHARIHPCDVNCAELVDRTIGLATAVKDTDPCAQILGPVLYGFNAYSSLQDAPDWGSEGAGYWWFVDYYLDKMAEAETTAGRRLLDVLDLHWYPEARDDPNLSIGHRITESLASYSRENAEARMQAPRTLWDPDYSEYSWIAYWFSDYLPLLPKVINSINNYYPQTKLSITEFDYGAPEHFSGGIAMADVLGIFGKYGLFMSTYWGGEEDYVSAAYKIYRNYDGAYSTFADTKVSAQMSDKQNSSIYASVFDGNDSELHLIVINKNFDSAINGAFIVTSGNSFTWGRVWSFDDSSAAITETTPITQITGNSFSYTIPALTVCHMVLYSQGEPPLIGDIDDSGHVDWLDVNMMAADWLNTSEIGEPNANVPNSPVLWYKFDESSGTTVPDEMGSFNGTIQNLTGQTWDTGGGYDSNGCINLTDGSHTYVTVPIASLNFASTATGVTFTVWVKTYSEYPPSGEWPQVINAWKDSTEVIQTYCPTPIPPTHASGPQVHFHVGSDNVGSATVDINCFADNWNHYAFVKDTDANTMSIYHNGQLLAESSDDTGPMFAVPVDSFHIGTRDQWWGYWVGMIDDLRIYDYALSEDEVAYVATGQAVPPEAVFDSPADLYKSSPDIIDFRDFALLGKDWGL